MQDTGSIVYGPFADLFNDYKNVSHVLHSASTKDLLTLRERQTVGLETNPRCSKLWLGRAATHLQLLYPELAASDAYKALRLINEIAKPADHATQVSARSESVVLLCEALFFTHSFKDCLDYVKLFRDASNSGAAELEPQCMAKLRRIRTHALRGLSIVQGQARSLGKPENSIYGEIRAAGYPWAADHHTSRSNEVRVLMREMLLVLSVHACDMQRSQVPDSIVRDCFGVYARHDVVKEVEETLFIEKPEIVAGKADTALLQILFD